MIELYVSGQKLTLTTPVLAADSLRSLRARVYFTDRSWDGAVKWLHFRGGDTVYDLQLDGRDGIGEDRALNLTAGEWTVYLTGVKGEKRLTTVPVILTVRESGLIDAPLHEVPMSALEQVSYRAELALRLVRELKHTAGLRVSGFYKDLEKLVNGVPEPYAGEAYAVGSAAPYRVYVWDGLSAAWVDAGGLIAVRAEGVRGVTFRPTVDEAGNISWVNDGAEKNPETVNLMGRPGETGPQGPEGKSAYASAAEHGYGGDEESFNAALAALPQHSARHLPGGADPITVKTANLEDGAVTSGKLANGAVTGDKIAAGVVSAVYTVTVGTGDAWTGASAPYTMTLAVSGLREADHVLADVLLSDTAATAQQEMDAFGRIYKMVTADDAITLYATDKTSVGLSIQLLAVKK